MSNPLLVPDPTSHHSNRPCGFRHLPGRFPTGSFSLLEFLPLILAVGLIAGWGAAATGMQPTVWTLANLALVGVFIFPVIVIHEAGHALVGRALGLRVFSVETGKGPPLFERWLGGTRVTLGRYGLQGQTKMLVPPGTSGGKWRMIASTAAGSVAQALALGVGLVAFGGGGLESVVSAFLTGPSPGAAFIGLSGAMLVLGLIPTMTILGGALVQSDMAQVLALLREPGNVLAPHTGAALVAMEANEAYRRRDYAQYRQLVAQGRTQHPDDFSFLMSETTPLGEVTAEQWREAHSSVSGLMKNPVWMRPQYFTYVMNTHAYYAVMTRDPSLLASADAGSSLVLGLAPLVPAFIGTRGAVLIQLGQVEEGLKLLRVAYKNANDRPCCAADAAWIAYGLARLGKLEEAKKWLRRARRVRPDTPEVAIVEAELAPRAPDAASDAPVPEAPPPPPEPSASPAASTDIQSDDDVVVSPLLPGRLYLVRPTTERGETWLIENAPLSRRLGFDEILGSRVLSATLLLQFGEHAAQAERRPERVRLLLAGGNTEPSPRGWFVPRAALGEILGTMRSRGLRVGQSGATVLSVVAQPIVGSAKGSAVDARSSSGAETGGASIHLGVWVVE